MKAVMEAPKPKNVTELRSFLGLVNYYGRCIQNLASVCPPLNRLLQGKVTWQWDTRCDKAFHELKCRLAYAQVLVHYDVALPLQLACDVSAYGLDAVFSHVLPLHLKL